MSRLCIYFLGTFQATLDGETIRFKTDKGRALLAYLAVENHRSHRREVLAGLLWSDQPEERALHSLRQTISSLRGLLTDKNTGESFLYADRNTVQFIPDQETWLDILAFESAAQEGLPQNQGSRDQRRSNVRWLKEALALYQGHFLDQLYLRGSPLFDEWAILQRESLIRRALEVMGVLVNYHEQRHETSLARQVAERIIELVPWEENAYRTVMRMLAQEGRYSAAQMSFQACERYLEAELGVPPAPETIALAEEIRQYAQGSTPYPRRCPSPRSNLPLMPTRFVGREAEMDLLAELIANPKTRLVTLLGPGGVGKSRLALHAARQQVGIFRDGVFFISLVPINDPDMVAFSLAEGIDFSFYSSKDPTSQLVDHLRDKEMLLVLDNVEHLLNSSSVIYDAICQILENAPGTVILVTSRQPLHFRTEQIIELGGLVFPSPQMTAAESAENLEAYSALRLFEQMGRRVNPRFSITADLSNVIDICRVLHGFPLAIELAASWVREFPVHEIASQIQRDLDFLGTTMRDVPDRHRSLRAVFEQSWSLLTKPEQAVFTKLSLFQGGFSAQAAFEVAEASEAALASLMNKSLLQEVKPGRFEMHNLVRQFAREKLDQQPGEFLRIAGRHCAYFSSFLQARQAELQGPNPLLSQREIGQEIDNIRASWHWAGQHHKLEQIQQAESALGRFYDMRSLFLEGKDAFGEIEASLEERLDFAPESLQVFAQVSAYHSWFLVQLGEYQPAVDSSQKLLARLSPPDTPLETCQILNILGSALFELGDFTTARETFARSIAIGSRAEAISQLAFAHNYLGSIARNQGAFQEAQEQFDRSLDLYKALDDQWGLARVLNNNGSMAGMSGDYAYAEAIFQESLAIRRKLHDKAGIAGCLHNLSNIAYINGDHEKTRALREECLVICQEIGFSWGIASTLKHLGDVDKAFGDYQQALDRYSESLEICQRSGDRRSEAFTLNSIGTLFLLQGSYPQARQTLTAALRTASEIEVVPLVLDILVGIAELTALAGDSRRAQALAAYVESQDGTERQTLDKARELRLRLEKETKPGEVGSGDATLDYLPLNQVVRQLLS